MGKPDRRLTRRAIIEMNRHGEKPLSLLENGKAKPVAKPIDLLAEAELSRFDKAKKKKKKNNKNIIIPTVSSPSMLM